MGRMFVRKLFLGVTSIALALTLVGGAYALTGDSTEPTEEPTVEQVEETTEPTPDPTPTDGDEQDDEGDTDEADARGGSVERIHEGCEGVEGLEGNWTHGDYVSAVAALGDPDATKAAAKSDCGKPNRGRRARSDDETAAKAKGGKPADGNRGRGNGGGDSGSGDGESAE